MRVKNNVTSKDSITLLSPEELVDKAASVHMRTDPWYKRLRDDADREYLYQVLLALKQKPSKSMRGVAALLRDRLGLNVSISTIRHDLSKLLSEMESK